MSTERLAEAGMMPRSVPSATASTTQAETTGGLYKTKMIKRGKPWRIVDQVEFATAEWIDWFNHRRCYQQCGDIPPAEAEAAYYAHHRAQSTAELSHQ